MLVMRCRSSTARCRRRRAIRSCSSCGKCCRSHSTPRKRDAALAALKRIPRAHAGRDVARAAEKARGEREARRARTREKRLSALRTGADVFRRSPRSAGDHPRSACRRAPGAEAAPAARRNRRAPHAAVRRRSADPAGRRARQPRRPAARATASGATISRSRRDRSQAALSAELPATVDAYRRAFLYLSHHGGATCTEADPHCSVCPLLKDCPEGPAAIVGGPNH